MAQRKKVQLKAGCLEVVFKSRDRASGLSFAAQGAVRGAGESCGGSRMTLKSQSSRSGGAEGSVNVTRSRVLMFALSGTTQQ